MLDTTLPQALCVMRVRVERPTKKKVTTTTTNIQTKISITFDCYMTFVACLSTSTIKSLTLFIYYYLWLKLLFFLMQLTLSKQQIRVYNGSKIKTLFFQWQFFGNLMGKCCDIVWNWLCGRVGKLSVFDPIWFLFFLCFRFSTLIAVVVVGKMCRWKNKSSKWR